MEHGCRNNPTPCPCIPFSTAHCTLTGTLALQVGTRLHLGHILHVLQDELVTGRKTYWVLWTAVVWEHRAFLTFPAAIWLFHISTDNSSRRSPRAFTHPSSAVCKNRDLPAQQTSTLTAAQSNSYPPTTPPASPSDTRIKKPLQASLKKKIKFPQLQKSRRKL